MAAAQPRDAWRERLSIPAYQVSEAARYAQISTRTVADWHRAEARATLSFRADRAALSYLQLIEVAVVAAFRKAKVKLADIRATREYMKREFGSDYPFAEYRFKRDGRRIVIPYEEIEGESGKGKVIRPDQDGQLAWNYIVGRLKEFEYDHDDIVIRWHVAGLESKVIIDPRIGFGAPTVRGTPTWILKGRYTAGEDAAGIADDFGLTEQDVIEALQFEGLTSESGKWVH